MPADNDYFSVIGDPDDWTDADLHFAEFTLAQKRRALDACDPEDELTRRWLRFVIKRIEASIARSRL